MNSSNKGQNGLINRKRVLLPRLRQLAALGGIVVVLVCLLSSISIDTGGPIELRFYVHHDLAQLATKLEGGEYLAVDDELSQYKPTQPLVDGELRYLKGLTSQALGRFDVASAEFETVLHNSADPGLIKGAKFGLFLCKLHQRKLWRQEYTFSTSSPAPELGPRMRSESQK
jgi:hypothetical protein